MASFSQQYQLLTLATLLQILRAGAWCTAGVVLLVQGIDPSVGAGVPVLRSLELRGLEFAFLGAFFIVNGAVQAWAGYHVSTWRKSKMWLVTLLAAAGDAIVWAEVGLRLAARNESGWALTGFIFCGLAALSALAVAAGRDSLTRDF